MTLEDLIADVEQDENAERRALLDGLPRVYELREALNKLTKDLKELEVPYREWLNLHPDEKLGEDDESLYVAFWQARSAGTAWDTGNAIKTRAPEVYARLQEIDALMVDDKRVQDAISRGVLSKGDVERYSHKRDGSPALLIRRKD